MTCLWPLGRPAVPSVAYMEPRGDLCGLWGPFCALAVALLCYLLGTFCNLFVVPFCDLFATYWGSPTSGATSATYSRPLGHGAAMSFVTPGFFGDLFVTCGACFCDLLAVSSAPFCDKFATFGPFPLRLMCDRLSATLRLLICGP